MIKKIAFLTVALSLVFTFTVNMNANDGLVKTVVSFTGKIIDSENKQPVGVEIFILNENGQKIGKANSNSSDGYFFLTGFKPGQNYSLLFVSDNYQIRQGLEIPFVSEYTEIQRDIELFGGRAELRSPEK